MFFASRFLKSCVLSTLVFSAVSFGQLNSTSDIAELYVQGNGKEKKRKFFYLKKIYFVLFRIVTLHIFSPPKVANKYWKIAFWKQLRNFLFSRHLEYYILMLIFKHNLITGQLGFFDQFIHFIVYYGVHVTKDMCLCLVEIKTIIIMIVIRMRVVFFVFIFS